MAQERARSKDAKSDDIKAADIKSDDVEKSPEKKSSEAKGSRFAATEQRRPGAAEASSSETGSKRRISLTERLQQRKVTEAQGNQAQGPAAPTPELRAERDQEPDSEQPARRRPAGPPPRRLATPANDDLPSIGGLIFSLQQKPSSTPFLIAGIASVVWFVIGGFLSYGLLTSESLSTTPSMLAAAMAIVIPIALFWFLALLVWRAQELRLMASAMTEVAVRLAEPDKLAEQSVASLGQVIRRQVAAMNDGISRAIGRASELEALVHNEVAALERSYGDNETRVRGLISELASEREALLNNSDRVSASLKGVGQQVAKDIAAATNEIDKNLADRGMKLTELLVARSNEAAKEVYKVQDVIAANMPGLLQELGKEQAGLTKLVEDAVNNLSALEGAVGARTEQFDRVMQERSAGFAMTLAERIQGLENLVEDGTRRIETTMQERSDLLDSRLQERSDLLTSQLQERTDALGSQIDRGAQTLVKTLEDGTEVFAVSADNSISGLETALRSRTDAFTSSINQGAVALDRTLAERSDSVSKTLYARLDAIDTAFGERAGLVARGIDERLTAIDKVLEHRSIAVAKGLDERLTLLDKAFEERGNAVNKGLDDRLALIGKTLDERGGKVTKDLDERLALLDKTFETRGAEVAKTLSENMKAIDETFEQRTAFATKRMDERLIAMDKQLQQRAGEVVQGLDERLKAIDTTIEQRGGAVTQNLDARLKAIDTTFQQRTGEVDQTLTKHVQGAEQTFGRQTELLHKVLSENSASLRETAAIVGKQSGQAVDVLTKQTDSLKEVSSGLLDQIHSLTQRFENQGQGILTAAKALETSNTKIDSILESRHQAIIGLLHTVNNKARELDDQMKNYVGVITNSMTEAEERAKHATQLLSRDTSHQARQAVAQIEKLRTDAQNHTARAVSDLKNSFAKVIGDLGQQMEQMRGQFANTSQGMREVARQTAGDLEALRHEMQTRMEALPEHTAQATEAIRKALANQISEIEAITPVLTSAATQGINQGIGQGSGQAPRQEESYRPAPAKETPSQPYGSSSDYGSYDPATPLSGETIPPVHQYDYSPVPEFDSYGRPTGGGTTGDIGDVAGNLAEQLSGASSYTEPSEPSFGGGNRQAGGRQNTSGSRQASGGGRGQQTPPPRQNARPAAGGAAPGGLRLDEIARAIDQRTAADVWQRYRSGQEGVLNRRLYTREGQGTFDEISRRYARDPEFRGTVDRYMSDFERLLGEAEQADPEGRMLDNYLVSETGRVYLLLAHASGRLR
ncbi:apolipoprotein A-IV repeat region-like domain-containing protein [Methyloligella solikamskensis]|uniref:Apolipoprotein A1/A4/E domain-containing protein n=1 Tax=Methyloligella solikamskensis TaxID=1177756 RepID=A0ABW3JBH2_9HYPH